MSPEILPSVPPFLRGTVFAAWFFSIAVALGLRSLRWLRVRPSSFTPAELGFVCAALGTGLLQLVPCALAVCSRMTASNVRWACAALTLLLGPDLVHLVRAVPRAWRSRPPSSVSRAAVVWTGLLAITLGIVLLQALAPGHLGDDDGYHLSMPKRWLGSGTLEYQPTYPNTNASLGFEMLYVIALSSCDMIGAKLLHYCAGLFSLFGVYLAAARLGAPLAGITAISALVVQTMFCNLPYILPMAYADCGVTLMAMAATVVWLVWRERKEPALFACFALLAGLAGSFKFTAAAFALAWVPALLVEERRAGATWPRCLRVVGGLGAISAIPILPWLCRNAVVVKNPVYPLLSHTIPSRDLTAAQASVVSRYIHYYAWGLASGPHLTEASRRHLVIGAVLFLLVCGGASAFFVRPPALRSLWVTAASFAVIAAALTGFVFRYWLPAILLATLVVTAALTRRWHGRPWRYAPASLLVIVALCQELRMRKGDLAADARLSLGMSTADREYAADPYWNMWKYVNASTEKDARVLAAAFYTSIGASQFGGYWVDRKLFTTDAQFQSFIRLDRWSSFLRSVRDAGITYVLIFESQYCAGRYGFSFTEGGNEYPFCRRLVDEYGEKVAQFGELQLYRVWPEEALRSAEQPSE